MYSASIAPHSMFVSTYNRHVVHGASCYGIIYYGLHQRMLGYDINQLYMP